MSIEDERLRYARAVAAAKYVLDIPVELPEQEARILENVCELALANDINEERIREYFQRLFFHSKAEQNHLINQWETKNISPDAALTQTLSCFKSLSLTSSMTTENKATVLLNHCRDKLTELNASIINELETAHP